MGYKTVALLALICCSTTIAARANDAERPASRPLILAHYMPWFESKPVSGTWGWHWTMNHFDPDRSEPGGKRAIASHYYPLIGAYDIADPDVLEYHTLLMKIAGIDGVIADWYGNEDSNDYQMIHRRTGALFDTLKRRGMKFAICYEDRALKAMAERQKLTPAQVVEHGRTHLRFCQDNWFEEPGYVTWDGKPLLLVFGPDYLTAGQWEDVFSGLEKSPSFFTLHERRGPAVGSFAWPPMWAAKDGTLGAKELDAYLERFGTQEGAKITAAFPGFHDIYQQAGAQQSHGYLDAADGATFRRTLEWAMRSASPIVQIATWNDFGEGTCVEPAREYEYRYLEAIQGARRQLKDEPFTYIAADLRLPLRIFELRKAVASTAPEQAALDKVVNLLFAADRDGATRQLDAIAKATTPRRAD